jgi:hypothetical protein
LPALNIAGGTWSIGYQFYGGITSWITPNNGTVQSGSPIKASTAKPAWMLAADLVVKFNNGGWSDPTAPATYSGTYNLPAHKSGTLPAGGNELLADGSVSWVKAVNMYCVYYIGSGAQPYRFYFYQSDWGPGLSTLMSQGAIPPFPN